jgi:hypothetical protein
MKRTIALVAAFFAVSPAYADYSVWDKGMWPESWPKELEPLRKQARTYEGPLAPNRHYAIRFTSRDEFESAWPHILKVKSEGAAIRLVRAPNFFLGEKSKAGVVVHCPSVEQIPGAANGKKGGLNSTYIELVVDGEIVDLNRILLPAGTPIVDERFKGGKNK